MSRPFLIACILISLFLSAFAQSCSKHAFTSNKVFSNCNDLPYLNSFLHYTYKPSSQTAEIAYRHTGITTARWVAWGINTQSKGMVGTQAIVALRKSDGTMSVYTSPVSSYQTNLQTGKLSFQVSDLSTTYSNNEITIFATLRLPSNVSSLNQVWQDGPLTNNSPGMHGTSGGNVQSMSTLNLISGKSKVVGSGSANPKIKKKNVSDGHNSEYACTSSIFEEPYRTKGSIRTNSSIHAVLNAVSWGIMMPLGAVIARYLKVFKITTVTWYYLHSTCQISAFIIGVAGWATGLQLGSQSPGIKYTLHRTIGIVLFCLATIQVTALLVRPKKENKFRKYWNIYHHTIGYGVLVLGIFNIFKGINILKPKGEWERNYIIFLWFLAAFAASMEITTWIIVLKRRKSVEAQKYSSNDMNRTNNGVHGYGSYRDRDQYGVA